MVGLSVPQTMPTTIEWTDETWNPVTGCVKVSPGCKHCYAETFAERFRGVVMPSGRLHVFHGGFDPELRPARLEQPFEWGSPRMVFVNSMSDLFGDFVPDKYLARVFDVMRRTPQHVYQVLTKRAARLLKWTSNKPWLTDAKHIWLGVSVEDRAYGVPRIDLLRRSSAGVKFLSVEPLLEDLGRIDLEGIDWVIVGGESGWRARPMDVQWVRSIRLLCNQAGVPFFFKQWGGVKKWAAGRNLDGRTWDEYPHLSHPALREGSRDGMHEAKRQLHAGERRRAAGSVRGRVGA
jgi:protein gp37